MSVSATESMFEGMARRAGIPEKGAYSLLEVSTATGVSYDAVRRERKLGRLRAFVPRGGKRGYRVLPEWADEWIEGNAG